MARAMNTRNLRFSQALFVMLLMATVSAWGQTNLITNGDFEQGNSGFYSNYEYSSGQVNEGQFCIDVNTSGHGGGLGWQQPSGNGGSEKFMMVNGRGSNNTEKVWATGTPSQLQAINVTTETYYRLSFKVANQNKYPGLSTKAKLEVRINDVVVLVNGQNYYTIQGDNNWHNWPSDNTSYYRWYSGNNTQALIEIRDVFEGNTGIGDDFCLDNISFVPETWYHVEVHSDTYQGLICLNNTVDIDVLDNDEISGDFEIEISQQPSHGECTILPNNWIRYEYNDEDNVGTTDLFKYRVNIQGHTGSGTTDETTVYITNLGQSLEIGEIQAPENPICEGYPLGIPAPSVTPNATGHWEYSSSQSGPWSELTNPNSIGLELNNKYIHYTASNDCGPSSSNAVQIHVSSLPTISLSPQIVDPICEGPNVVFELPTITLGNNGYNAPILPGGQGWRIADNPNGPFNEPFTNTNITYNNHNGRYICYYAENDCGPNYSNPIQLVVNAAPIVPNIQTPAGICEGGSFNLTTPQPINWRDNNAPSNTHSYGWEIQDPITGEWGYLVNNNIPFEYNGCHIRYMAHNVCDYGYSNEVALTVYSTQPVVLPDVTFCQEGFYHGVWCSQDGLVYGFDSITPNNCTIHVSWLFHLSEDYNTHPQTETECNEFYWPQTGIIYHNSGIYYDTVPNPNPVECDDVYILNLTINHPPVITEQLESPNPIEVCSSVGALNVTAPSFENGGTNSWEYATSENGPWNNGFNPASFNLEYGSYWLRYVVDNDCADVPVTSNPVPFYVSEAPAVSIAGGQQLHDLEICYGEVMDWPQVLVEWKCQPDGLHIRRWEKASEQYGTYAPFDTTAVISNDCWIRYYVQNSCGEVVLGPVQVSVLSVQDEWQSHEDCDMVEFEGVQYVEDTVINVMVNEPCPHTIHHNIIVHHSEYTMEPIPQTTCHDEFVWHGHTYYRSDGLEQLMHFDTLTEYGCNKTLEQQLVFDDYSTKIESKKACGTYYWPRNDSTYVYDESHLHIQDSWFIPGNGDVCDSIIYLSLDLGRDYELEGDPLEPQCYGFEWHGVSYYEDAIVYDSLKTAITQCDSIISYRLTIVQPFDTVVAMENCKPVWWQDHLFEEDGEEFTATLTSSLTGCDSIVTMHFSLTPEIEKQLDTLACEAFSWYGHYFSENGQASHTFLTPAGCDSTVYLNVNFLQADIFTDEPVSACNSYTFHGVTYGPGIHEIYHDTVFALNGCISEIQLLNLTVKDSEQMGTITGASSVYVATNLISGIYRYEIDMTGLTGTVTWSLSNSDWQIVESGIGFCRVWVTTPGTAILTAHFQVEECGEMERIFEINAGFFDIDEAETYQIQVYPNPTKGTVHIEAEGIESIRLTNMMGQVLEVREYGRADSLELNLSGYVPSVYLLEIKTAYGVVKRRVVVCR